MTSHDFQKRINYQGDISMHLKKVCENFDLGSHVNHIIIPQGYEDFNVVIKTTKQKYFVKYFAASRSLEECRRLIEILSAVIAVGVNAPVLLSKKNGEKFTQEDFDSTIFRYSVFEYIDGSNLFELAYKPSVEDKKFIIKQAAKINSLSYRPVFVYDSWAISSFLSEFEKKKDILEAEDRKAFFVLISEFKSLNFDILPHCLVHGDLIRTNLMKDKSGIIWFIDFSVANWYPRIQELAVLLCDILFDPENVQKEYDFVLEEYQKYIKLTDLEITTLPLFVKIAHAMHVLNASFEKANGNYSKENEYWLNLGRTGLKSTQRFL